MSISVLVAIAGVLVAAVGTGLLAGQCVRRPQTGFVAWAVAMLAITVALLAQSIGFATGFGPWTFRLVQLSAQFVAPLALAWGLVEFAARSNAVRFGARLVAAAVVSVAGVVLATDPLAVTQFSKKWPSGSTHYQVIPSYALIAVALLSGATALTVLAVCAARGHGTPASGPPVIGVAAVTAAALLLIALRFSLPGPAYPVLCAMAAGTLWFGGSRVGDRAAGTVQADQTDQGDPAGQGVPAPAAVAAGAKVASDAEGADGVRRSRGFRSDRGSRPADDPARPPAEDFGPPDFPPPGRASARPDDRDQRDWPGRDWPGGQPGYQPGVPGSEPATGMFDASLPELGDLAWPASPAMSQPGADLALPVTPPHGLIAIYTLLEDKVADFDRVADEVAEQVRANEPDTLVYVIHTVPKAPMQRIFYEVYRDRAAYSRHEQQPYVQRFVTARRPYVLATNVIELRLKFAKVSPLPQAEAQAAQAQAAQAQAQRPPVAPSLPAVRNGNGERPADSRPARPRHGGGRPDTPDYPSRDPGYPPREPAYQSREPSDPPRQPAYPSREPAYPSREPSDPPREPAYQSREPSYQPRDPGYGLHDPDYEPHDPGYQRRDPGYQGRDPGYEPRDPGYPPRTPQFIPRNEDYPAYPSRDQEYPPPDPGYPPRGRTPDRAQEPRDGWSREPRDWPREPRDPYAGSRDPYDPPAESWYDRI